jgi:adenosyl cobinamide kinase/adenosyl cobinamide phosphate guanylyltransferase
MKLNCTHQLLVYVDDISMLVGKVHTIKKKNTENLLFSSEEMGIEVNVNKTKFKVMFRDQSAELHQNKKNG